MRWKWNLVLNNDDGKKTIQKTIYKNYLHKKIKTTIPTFTSGFPVSMSLSKIEIK